MVVFFNKKTKQYLQVDEKGWLTGDSDASLPLAKRAFSVVQLPADAEQGPNWVALKSAAAGLFLEMVPRTQPLAWVVREVKAPMVGSGSGGGLGFSPRQKWKLDGGRILNMETRAFVNLSKNRRCLRSVH